VNNLGAQVSAANPVALANLAKNDDTSY
jgi:hypothetical protein